MNVDFAVHVTSEGPLQQCCQDKDHFEVLLYPIIKISHRQVIKAFFKL